MKKAILIIISLYRTAASPILMGLGAHCRFHPSCSEYAMQAFEDKGFFTAMYLTIRRLMRCGPWNEGGVDVLPGN